MIKPIRWLIAASLCAVALPASAATYTWDFNGNLAPGSGLTCAGGAACKFTVNAVGGGQTMTVKAYSTPVYDSTSPFDITGNWKEGRIARYSGGIGVSNLVSSDTNETVAPEHAVDNQGVKDLVIFELPTLPSGYVWDVASFMLGYASGDSDVQAWIGGSGLTSDYDFRNVCFSGCTGAAQTISTLGFTEITDSIPAVSGGTTSPGGASGAGGINVPTNVAVPFNTDATGKYLIMSGNLGQYGITGDNDAFKISALTAYKNATGVVPVPGSLALVGLGLAAFGFARRRG